MRLAAKLILVYLIGLAAVVVVFTWLTIRDGRRLAAADQARRAAELVAVLRPRLSEALATGDRRVVQSVLDRTLRTTGLRRIEVRYVPRPERVAAGRVVTLVRRDDGTPCWVSRVSLSRSDPTGGAIEIRADDPQYATRLYQSLRRSGLALAAVTLLSGGVIYVGGVRMVGRPLDRLIDRVERIGRGEFSTTVGDVSRDELGQLTDAVDRMGRSLASQQEQIRRADRLATVGRLAAGVAHEIGTPLNVVAGHAELIAGGQLPPEQVARSATAIHAETGRIRDTVGGLLEFARGGGGDRRKIEFSLADAADEAAEMFDPALTGRDAVVVTSIPSHLRIVGDSTAWRQVFGNLLDNAIAAGADRIDIEAKRSGGSITIRIDDNGDGMDAETREHMFEPFYTTKDVGSGTGLGLSIVHGIVTEHGGTIDVRSEIGGGTTFEITVPLKRPVSGGPPPDVATT